MPLQLPPDAPPPHARNTVLKDGQVSTIPVGKDVQPEQFPVDAAGRGDDRRQEGVTHTLGRVARPMFVNLLLCPL